MRVVRNNLLPPGKRYAAINLFGVLFVKRGVSLSPELINHERIHTAQMREMLFLFFYIAYVAEWLGRVIGCRGDFYRAYLAISFEREAYRHDNDLRYLQSRRLFAQWRKIQA